MTAPTTFDRVKRILLEEVGLTVDPEKITPEASFIDDLDADSLDMVEMIIEAEDELDFRIEDDQAGMECRTVGDFVALVDRLVAA